MKFQYRPILALAPRPPTPAAPTATRASGPVQGTPWVPGPEVGGRDRHPDSETRRLLRMSIIIRRDKVLKEGSYLVRELGDSIPVINFLFLFLFLYVHIHEASRTSLLKGRRSKPIGKGLEKTQSFL